MACLRLITHAGDMGDVDGFYALAEYAKTGADVLFILNYPAYFNVEYSNALQTENAHGLGYTYSTHSVLEVTRLRFSEKKEYEIYDKVLKRFGLEEGNQDAAIKFKKMYTLLALVMCHEVWNACPVHVRGELHFCVGGVNSIDPFDIHEVNNELFLYADILDRAKTELKDLNITEGTLMNLDGSTYEYTLETVLAAHTDIYIDFNGSMAYLTPTWRELIAKACREKRVRGAFIQGGVYSYVRSRTVPKRMSVINRMSCAIMNQLYAPAKSASLFDLMKANNITMYVVANNDIEPLTDYRAFFQANNIDYTPVINYADRFYHSRPDVRVKPYDFYVALVICTAIKDPEQLYNISLGHTLYYNPIYAATLLSKDNAGYVMALAQYFEALEINQLNDINALQLQDKTMWQIERNILLGCDWAEYAVRTFLFNTDNRTMRLTIEAPHGRNPQ
jgi:hypothetical protein